MARLPRIGKDDDNWGEILNEFLSVSLDETGRLKPDSVGSETLQANSVMAEHIDSSQSLMATASIPKLYYAPEDYGCALNADPSINDAALAAAMADAALGSGIVQFIGQGPYTFSKAIDHDVSKVSVVGCKTVLQTSATFSSTYFWSMYSSADYPYPRNQGTALSGVILAGKLLGTPPQAGAGIQIGHTTYTNNSLFSISQVYLMGFETGFRFIQNAWRIKVVDCRVTGGTAISAAAGLANFGENILFENCFIESWWPKITISNGEWTFINTSFNSTLISLEGGCMVKLQNCHLEPHDIYPCVSLKHPEAEMIMHNTTWIVDPAVKINNAAFEVVDSNKTKGLIIRDMDTIMSANYNPQVNSRNCVLVAGDGRVDMQGFASNTNGYGYAISRGANMLYNGDAEKGTTAGWTTYAAYGPTTFTTDTTYAKNGTKSFKLTIDSSSIYVGQAVACRPGQWVFAQCWNKLQIDSGKANTSVSLDFLNSKDEVILTIGYLNITETTWWTCRRNLTGTSPVAPPGTASVRFYVALAGSKASAWYDEFILNVV